MTIIITPTTLNWEGNAAPGYLQPLDLSILSIGASTDYSFGMTVTLRKKTTSVQNDNHCLMAFDFDYGGSHGGAFYVNATDGSMVSFFGQNVYTSSTGLVAYNTEQQITITLTGTTMKAYVQGTLVWTQTVTRVATGGGVNSYFLQEGFQFRGLYGRVRQIFITKTLLTQSDVTNIVAGTYPTLGGYWKLDEGVGFACADSSGNGNIVLVVEGASNSPFPDWRGSNRRSLI